MDKYNKYTKEQYKAVEEAYNEGYTYQEIADLTGVKKGAVSFIMKGKTNRSTGSPLAKSIQIPPTQTQQPEMNAEELDKYIAAQKAPVQKDELILYSANGKFAVGIEATLVTIRNQADSTVLTLDRSEFSTLVPLLVKADKIAEVL